MWVPKWTGAGLPGSLLDHHFGRPLHDTVVLSRALETKDEARAIGSFFGVERRQLLLLPPVDVPRLWMQIILQAAVQTRPSSARRGELSGRVVLGLSHARTKAARRVVPRSCVQHALPVAWHTRDVRAAAKARAKVCFSHELGRGTHCIQLYRSGREISSLALGSSAKWPPMSPLVCAGECPVTESTLCERGGISIRSPSVTILPGPRGKLRTANGERRTANGAR